MAAFFIDSVFSSSSNDPIKNPGFSDEFFQEFHQLFSFSSSGIQEGSSLKTISNEQSSCLEQQSNSNSTEHLEREKQRNSESFTSMAENGDQITQILDHFGTKRKFNHGSSLNSANSKEVKQAKCKKQKGSKEGMKDGKNDDKKGEDEARREPSKGYIHVRARRGQATDSHSLAERARREKISQKMKTLQALVPGCDKVTGKALMLDEIINYIQSLQNQVELLSMKLTSLDPMVYIFGLMDHDTMPFGTEVMNIGTPILPMSSIQSTSDSNTNGYSRLLAFANTNTITNSTTTTAVFADSSVNLLQHEHKPNAPPLRDARSSQWGLDDLQQDNIINQFAFRGTNNNNLYSF